MANINPGRTGNTVVCGPGTRFDNGSCVPIGQVPPSGSGTVTTTFGSGGGPVTILPPNPVPTVPIGPVVLPSSGPIDDGGVIGQIKKFLATQTAKMPGSPADLARQLKEAYLSFSHPYGVEWVNGLAKPLGPNGCSYYGTAGRQSCYRVDPRTGNTSNGGSGGGGTGGGSGGGTSGSGGGTGGTGGTTGQGNPADTIGQMIANLIGSLGSTPPNDQGVYAVDPSTYAQTQPQQSSNSLLIVVVIVAVAGGAFYYYDKHKKKAA